MHVESDICLLRRIQRDINERGRQIDNISSQYITTVKPMFDQYIRNYEQYADVIVAGGGKDAKITEILYDQIGHGWVPHKTFMNACAWKEDEYFAASGEPGRMQRQLNIIRKNLGVAIEFRKGKGVRFVENIVKSK